MRRQLHDDVQETRYPSHLGAKYQRPRVFPKLKECAMKRLRRVCSRPLPILTLSRIRNKQRCYLPRPKHLLRTRPTPHPSKQQLHKRQKNTRPATKHNTNQTKTKQKHAHQLSPYLPAVDRIKFKREVTAHPRNKKKHPLLPIAPSSRHCHRLPHLSLPTSLPPPRRTAQHNRSNAIRRNSRVHRPVRPRRRIPTSGRPRPRVVRCKTRDKFCAAGFRQR